MHDLHEKGGRLRLRRQINMKKIINDPSCVVSEMLEGIAAVNPEVVYHPGFEVLRRRRKTEKVGLVSGGGSGHEPSFAGYVGPGMLDAAVSGNVFASPSPERIVTAIKESDCGKGVLLLLMNYSGDVMNFEMARDIAECDGISVEIAVVKDDVSTEDDDYSAGRRGIAGTVLVHKVVGAKAEQGADLAAVAETARKAIANVRTMGMAMSSCILPAVGTPGFFLGENEIEIGMGIHGEPGIKRTEVMPARELAHTLLEKIFADRDYDGQEVAVMVNGLGATPLMELYILAREVNARLLEKDIRVHRYFVGEYMTSLEMSGASVSLMALDDELKALIDAPCDTMALKVGRSCL